MEKKILKLMKWVLVKFFTEKTKPEVKHSDRNSDVAKIILAINNLEHKL